MKPNRIPAKFSVALLALALAGCGQPAAQAAQPAAGTPAPTGIPAATATNTAGQPTAVPPAPSATPKSQPTTGQDAAPIATVRDGGNVRSAPSTEGTVVIDQINPGETVLLRMRASDGQWFSIVDPRGVVGWSWVGLLAVDPIVAARVPTGDKDSGVATVPTPTPAGDPGTHQDGPEVVTWEGLQLKLPAGYSYQAGSPSGSVELGGAIIRAALDLLPADSSDRMRWRTVTYSGSPQDFLSLARESNGGDPWVDDGSVRQVTVAGMPGLVYNRAGAPQFQNYIVRLNGDALLLIDSYATRPEQARVLADLLVVGAPSEPSGSGSHEIAYVAADRSLMLLDVATGQSRAVAAGPAWNPAWSPDGVWLAYTRGGDNGDIYAVDVAAGREEQITRGPDGDDLPSFSPSGGLYFIRQHPTNAGVSFDIVEATKAGTEEIVYHQPVGACLPYDLRAASDSRFAVAVTCGPRVTVLLVERGGEPAEDIAQKYRIGGGCVYEAAWAPGRTNTLGVLISDDCRRRETTTAYTLDLSTIQLPAAPTFAGKGIASMDFAPDGRALVFDTSDDVGKPTGLWSLNVGGQSAPQQLPAAGMHPVWRP